LRIESSLVLETFAAERPPFQITPDALRYPFIYSADDRIDLGRMLERHYPDPNDRLGSWARGFVRSNPTDTSALAGIEHRLQSQPRGVPRSTRAFCRIGARRSLRHRRSV
jgi:hypothetical protein